MRQRGMTLLEVAAVLFLLGLLAALALPRLRGAGGTESRICRDQLLRDLRTSRAIAIGRMCRTGVYAADSGYVLDLGGEPLTRPLPRGFSIRIQGRGEGAGISFTPDGRSNGGTIELWTGERAFIVNVGEEGRIAEN